MAKKPLQTTRNTEFNYYKDNDTIASVMSFNTTNEIQNIKLLDAEDGIKTSDSAIREHAKANTTMIDLGYNVRIDDEDASGFIYMENFFGVDVDEETGEVTGRTIDDYTNYYGNGRIERLYYKNNNTNVEYATFDTDLETIASQVAGWLSANDYSSAYEAFADDAENLDALIQCYTVNA